MTTPDASTTDERANAVPLIEQLRSVPLNAHHFVEINPTHHRNIPYGPWCHAAADEIEQLRELLSIAQDRNAEHCAEVQRLRDICHRLNAAYGGADDVPGEQR